MNAVTVAVLAAALVGGYLLGSIPFGLLLTRSAGLGDIRAIGSGNIGATNVLRTGRKELAAATLLLDAAKGALAVLVAGWGGREAMLVAGLGAVLGHLFPLWLRFRGGKGMATALGVLIASAWPVGVLACVVWLVVAGLFRRSSLAALLAILATPFLAWWFSDRGEIVLAAVITVLVWIRHHENIRRLLAGTEPRIGQKR